MEIYIRVYVYVYTYKYGRGFVILRIFLQIRAGSPRFTLHLCLLTSFLQYLPQCVRSGGEINARFLPHKRVRNSIYLFSVLT